MTRRMRILAFVLLSTFALGTAACADVAAPSNDCGEGYGNSGTTCFAAGYGNSGT